MSSILTTCSVLFTVSLCWGVGLGLLQWTPVCVCVFLSCYFSGNNISLIGSTRQEPGYGALRILEHVAAVVHKGLFFIHKLLTVARGIKLSGYKYWKCPNTWILFLFSFRCQMEIVKAFFVKSLRIIVGVIHWLKEHLAYIGTRKGAFGDRSWSFSIARVYRWEQHPSTNFAQILRELCTAAQLCAPFWLKTNNDNLRSNHKFSKIYEL